MRTHARAICVGFGTVLITLAVVVGLLILHPRVDHLKPLAPDAGESAVSADSNPLLDAFNPHASPRSVLGGGGEAPIAWHATSNGDADIPPAPTTEEELRAFVDWLNGLPPDRLLFLSNAEFAFEGSRIIETLRGLEGEWVVPGLGRLAVGATHPLVKAVLVVGLCKGAGRERLADPRLLNEVGQLLPQLSSAESDPYHACRYVVFSTYGASICQQMNFAELVLPHLEGADNPDLLVRGYLFLGQSPGSEDGIPGGSHRT